MLNQYFEELPLTYDDVGYDFVVKPSVFLRKFQEIAGVHTDLCGYGRKELLAKNLHWILDKNYIEVEKKVVFGGKYRIGTWPKKPGFVLCDRNYVITDDKGEVYVRAVGRWCLLDITTGKISKTLGVVPADEEYVDDAVSCENWKIDDIPLDSPVYSITAAYCDLDYNRHVNNAKYADFMFNAFSTHELDAMKMTSFQLNYMKECFEGDRLDFFRKETGVNEFTVVCIKNGTECAMKGRVKFDNI